MSTLNNNWLILSIITALTLSGCSIHYYSGFTAEKFSVINDQIELSVIKYKTRLVNGADWEREKITNSKKEVYYFDAKSVKNGQKLEPSVVRLGDDAWLSDAQRERLSKMRWMSANANSVAFFDKENWQVGQIQKKGSSCKFNIEPEEESNTFTARPLRFFLAQDSDFLFVTHSNKNSTKIDIYNNCQKIGERNIKNLPDSTISGFCLDNQKYLFFFWDYDLSKAYIYSEDTDSFDTREMGNGLNVLKPLLSCGAKKIYRLKTVGRNAPVEEVVLSSLDIVSGAVTNTNLLLGDLL